MLNPVTPTMEVSHPDKKSDRIVAAAAVRRIIIAWSILIFWRQVKTLTSHAWPSSALFHVVVCPGWRRLVVAHQEMEIEIDDLPLSNVARDTNKRLDSVSDS